MNIFVLLLPPPPKKKVGSTLAILHFLVFHALEFALVKVTWQVREKTPEYPKKVTHCRLR